VKVAPQKLQQTVHLTRNLGLNIVYSEDLVDPGLANTIAQEIPNGKVVEKLQDYFILMKKHKEIHLTYWHC